jgi:hypothetical protein
MHIHEEPQSTHWVFDEPKEASVDEGPVISLLRPVISLLQGSRLSYDADNVPTNCNQGYQARVPKDGHHPHVLLLFKDLTEVISQARAK